MNEPAAAGAVPSPKVNPQTLVLRGAPVRVVRFRRGAIIGLAALGSTALVGVTWMALKPASFKIVASDEHRGSDASPAASDALANAPKSYGEIPALGPPLPGDLGRPILEHQRSIGPASSADPSSDAAARAAGRAEAERQRIAAERKAARESGIIMQISRAAPAFEAALGPPSEAGGAWAQGAEASPAASPSEGSSNRQRNVSSPRVGGAGEDVNPHALTAAASPYMLSAGSVIAASLITGLNSDLPGLVTAQVTQNAHDSVTGRVVLIPQGARLIGSYDNVVAFGQRRALVVWQRLIMPDGSSLRIDNMPASDTSGYAGLADKIDRHTWQLLKGVALSTLLGVGTELSIGGESDFVRAIRESTQQNGARAGDQLVSRNLDVQPTITVRPGWPLRVLVNKDLMLRPWEG